MSWLDLLRRDLDDDEFPIIVVSAIIPPGVWWSDDSLPCVHVSVCALELVMQQFSAAFGGYDFILTEGDA